MLTEPGDLDPREAEPQAEKGLWELHMSPQDSVPYTLKEVPETGTGPGERMGLRPTSMPAPREDGFSEALVMGPKFVMNLESKNMGHL